MCKNQLKPCILFVTTNKLLSYLELLEVPSLHVQILLMPGHPVVHLPGELLIVALQVLLNHLAHPGLLFEPLFQLALLFSHTGLSVGLVMLIHLNVYLAV